MVVGKTNMVGVSMGSTTETSAFGATADPWNDARVPGGSSGGSAAAVAAAQCVLALGSDTEQFDNPPRSPGEQGTKPTCERV